jgi:predicted phage baseplate assembly protein
VTQLKATVPYVEAVTNVEPAGGGADAESLDRVRERGPKTLRHRDRAVAASDFEDLALEASAEVARVRVLPATGPAGAGRVGLVVVPKSADPQPIPSLELLGRVEEVIRRRVAPTVDLWVGGPGWLRVSVAAEVVPVRIEEAANVETEVRARLARFLHPLTGGIRSTGWEFGRAPHRSDLYALIEGTPGVDHVRRLGVTEILIDKPPAADAFLLYATGHELAFVGASE